MRTWLAGILTGLMLVTGSTGPVNAAPGPAPFIDVASDHVFYDHIAWLADTGISTGYDNGNGTWSFAPSAPVLREQMAAFLYRLAGDPEFDAPTTSPFTDVATSHTFYKHIAWLADTGISTGYDNGNGTKSFAPSAPVLREQMAAFLYRFEGVPDDMFVIASFFRDVAQSHVFKREIDWLSSRGISTGYIDGSGGWTFQPAEPVLREQMAAFMYRLEDVDGDRTPVVDAPQSLTVTIGTAFSQTLTDPRTNGGSWAVRAGDLPPGVTLVNRSPLVIDGVATIEGRPITSGTYTATLRYQTSQGRADTTISITVTDPNTVDPADATTRSDLAVSFHQCEAPEVMLPETSPFSDLDRDDPRFEAIYWSHVTNVIPAVDGLALPDEPLTRALAAEHMYRFMGDGLQPVPGHQIFIDVTPDHPNYAAINWTAATGVIVGNPIDLFQPDNFVTPVETERYRYVRDFGDECVPQV